MARTSRRATIDHRMAFERSRVARGLARQRRLLGPAALSLIAVVAGSAGGGPAGVSTFVLLAGALAATVWMQWSLRNTQKQPVHAVLRTPGELALAVCFVVAVGGVLAVVGALVLSAVASFLVGDGNLAVRLLLAVFAIGPCFSIGFRFARWWAFLGALTLIPLLGFAMLVGSGPASGLGLLAVAVLTSAFALAAGALNAQLAYEGHRR